MPIPTAEDLIPAVKRFNRWQFPETQTMFRDLAEATDGRERRFLLAISEIAGAFAKIWHKGGEPHAMVSMLARGIETLKKFAPEFLFFEITEFAVGLSGCLDEAKRWRRGDVEIFNRDLIPRVRFSPK